MSVTDDLATFTRDDDHIDVRFERHYPRPVETVWSAITEPERLADWMGVSRVEPRVGGRFDVMIDGPHPVTGRVRVWEPPRLLELAWSNTHAPDSVIRFELEPVEGGSRLVFTHRRMPYVNSALMLPGWHAFLGKLGAMLDGEATKAEPDGWRKMQEIYVDRYRLVDVNLEP